MNFKFLKILKSPDSNILDLLNRNIIGTPGRGMLYQHLGVIDKISKIAEPYFAALIKGDRAIGTCCFCKRSIVAGQREITAFYVRYFSFNEKFRRKSVAIKSLSRRSKIRNEVYAMLDGAGLEVASPLPFFHYAYVDPRNVRSAELCKEFGFQPVRRYTSIIFSSVNPNDNTKEVQELAEDEVPEMKTLLQEFYNEYNMFSFENLFGRRRYFVIKDNDGNILAGAQANPEYWKILALPGITGKVILNVFSGLPILKKLINKNYRFLTIEGIFYRPNAEAKLEVLFEALLQQHEMNSAIMVVDSNSDLYKKLKSLRLGLVNKINPEVHGQVICRFTNLTEAEKSTFEIKPAYISGIDVT